MSTFEKTNYLTTMIYTYQQQFFSPNLYDYLHVCVYTVTGIMLWCLYYSATNVWCSVKMNIIYSNIYKFFQPSTWLIVLFSHFRQLRKCEMNTRQITRCWKKRLCQPSAFCSARSILIIIYIYNICDMACTFPTKLYQIQMQWYCSLFE